MKTKDYPLLLSAEMVRATLDGLKTQTRRVVKPQPPDSVIGFSKRPSYAGNNIWGQRLNGATALTDIRCPLGQPGDRLYVKEGYQIDGYNVDGYEWFKGTYTADGEPFALSPTPREFNLWKKRKYPNRKTSGRFMYKSLARIWLEVINVRVERVQDISEEDAIAEGLRIKPQDWMGKYKKTPNALAFVDLWDSLHFHRGHGWDQNDWVWVVEFEVVKP